RRATVHREGRRQRFVASGAALAAILGPAVRPTGRANPGGAHALPRCCPRRTFSADMNDYILLMYNDVPEGRRRPSHEWSAYFAKLREAAAFQGGSSIGGGLCVRKGGGGPQTSGHIDAYTL